MFTVMADDYNLQQIRSIGNANSTKATRAITICFLATKAIPNVPRLKIEETPRYWPTSLLDPNPIWRVKLNLDKTKPSYRSFTPDYAETSWLYYFRKDMATVNGELKEFSILKYYFNFNFFLIFF